MVTKAWRAASAQSLTAMGEFRPGRLVHLTIGQPYSRTGRNYLALCGANVRPDARGALESGRLCPKCAKADAGREPVTGKRRLTSHQQEVFGRLTALSRPTVTREHDDGTVEVLQRRWVPLKNIGSRGALDHIVEKGYAQRRNLTGPRGGSRLEYRLFGDPPRDTDSNLRTETA